MIKTKVGIGAPSTSPPVSSRTNLLIGQTQMLWSSGGYLYFHLLSNSQPLWEFAPCDKTNLTELTLQDVPTSFVCMSDKTNGPAAFGTNWLKNAIRVQQGQVLFARQVNDPARTYALEVAKQEFDRVIVFYIALPP